MDILKELNEIKGKCGYYYKNLITGEKLNYNSDDEYHPASLIKLPVLMAIMKMVKEGKASLKDKIIVKYEDRVPSCGAFNAFSDEPIVDVETLCNLMIVISDNTAFNLLIKHFGIKELTNTMRKLGFLKSRLERGVYDDEMQALGYNNKVVPNELGMMLEKLYKKELIDAKTSEFILDILKKQQLTGLIPLFFENKYMVANKTGSTSRYLADAGIVYCNKPFVYVIISNDTNIPETTMIYNRISKILFEEDLLNGDL